MKATQQTDGSWGGTPSSLNGVFPTTAAALRIAGLLLGCGACDRRRRSALRTVGVAAGSRDAVWEPLDEPQPATSTAAQKIDPADPTKQANESKLSVIDLKANPPAVIATLEAGPSAAGVSINRQGTLALVANRSEGTVSVYTIQGKTVTPAGKVTIADDKRDFRALARLRRRTSVVLAHCGKSSSARRGRKAQREITPRERWLVPVFRGCRAGSITRQA